MTASAPQLVFSVVVPTLGRARQLQGCLGALDALDYPPERFEVVIVNDGGGPEIERLASGWEDRLAIALVSTPEVGPAAARNVGAKRARGELLAFTDDDCEPKRGWLRSLEGVLEANPGAAVGGTVVNGATSRCSAASQAALDATHAHFNRDPAGRRFFASNNFAVEADGFRAVGGFDESFPFAEDRELCDRWVASGRRLEHAPDAIVRHMRELTLPQFWRQHFGYGRGAWAFHRARAERGRGRLTVESRFYAELARQVSRRRAGAGRPSLAALAFISQVANASGFAREALAARLGSRPHGAPAEGVSR